MVLGTVSCLTARPAYKEAEGEYFRLFGPRGPGQPPSALLWPTSEWAWLSSDGTSLTMTGRGWTLSADPDGGGSSLGTMTKSTVLFRRVGFETAVSPAPTAGRSLSLGPSSRSRTRPAPVSKPPCLPRGDGTEHLSPGWLTHQELICYIFSSKPDTQPRTVSNWGATAALWAGFKPHPAPAVDTPSLKVQLLHLLFKTVSPQNSRECCSRQ